MRGTQALSAAAMLVALVLAAGAVSAERGPFAQLPQDWQRLFPSEAEIVSLEAFPIVAAPTDGRPVPFALPGTPLVAMAPEVEYEIVAGAVELVSVPYQLAETSTWTADGREVVLWTAQFEVGVRVHGSEAELAAVFAEDVDPDRDEPVALGDQAYFVGQTEDHEAQLEVRTGRYEVGVRFEVAPGIFRGVAPEPLRRLARGWAALIVGRITGAAAAPTAAATATGSRVAVTAQAAGFAPQTQDLIVPAGRVPGEITVRVTVRTVAGGVARPAPGASVSLPDYGVAATTSAEGTAVLRARGPGQDPVVGVVGFDLEPATETGPPGGADDTDGEGDGQAQTGGTTTAGTAAAETLPTAPEPQPEPLDPVPLAADSAVRRAVVCQGVDEQGELAGCLEIFPAGTEKVSLYLEIVGARPNSEVQVTWYLDGKIIGRELVLVSGDRRLLSYLYAQGRQDLWAGAYAVELRENGALVGRLVFRVAGAG